MILHVDISSQKQSNVKRIVNAYRSRTPNRPAMVILNSDYDYGMYVKELNRIFKEIGMVEQHKLFRQKSLTNITTGDFIVVGEETPYYDYDFRVTSDQDELEDLDGRRFKAYDLIDDWDNILNKLQKYGRFTTNRSVYDKFRSSLVDCREPKQEVRFQRPSILDLTVEAEMTFTPRRAEKKVSYTEIFRPTERKEKVTIFDNWVKVGYRQFDIFYDMFGQEQISYDGTTLYVKSDRYGRKYLAVR